MLIAVDKNSLQAVKKDKNNYVYLYEEEKLENLLKLDLHCMNYKYLILLILI